MVRPCGARIAVSFRIETCPLCHHAPGGGGRTGAGGAAFNAPADLDIRARPALSGTFAIDGIERRTDRSITYTARRRVGNERVVLQVWAIPPHDAARAETLMRALEAATLDHPHIAQIDAHGRGEGLVWYAAGAIASRSLSDIIAGGRAMELRRCLRIVEQVGSALTFAHGRGVIHGDLRPAHILVDDAGWTFVKDFGIDLVLRETAGPAPDFLPGAEEYRAPEQIRRRQPAPAVDQYGLAATVFECLAGAPPFEGDTTDVIRAAKFSPPSLGPIRPDLPQHVGDALRRALSPLPAERYPTVVEFVTALSTGAPRNPLGIPARLDGPVSAKNPAVLFPTAPPGHSRWPLVTAALIGAGALIGVPFFPLDDDPPRRRSAGPAAGVSALPRPSVRGLPTREPQEAPPNRTVSDLAVRVRAASPPPAAAAPIQPAASTSPPLDSARLYLSSIPWGRVYLDDLFLGNTPLAGHRVAPGSYRLRIGRDGYQTFERHLEVGPGQEIRITGVTLGERDPE